MGSRRHPGSSTRGRWLAIYFLRQRELAKQVEEAANEAKRKAEEEAKRAREKEKKRKG